MSTYFDRAKRKKRKYKVTDRMAVEEIYESVDSQCHLTFDYLLFCFVAAMISGVGLIQDSSVTVVASMLVSPLMGPILGVTFGTVIRYDLRTPLSFAASGFTLTPALHVYVAHYVAHCVRACVCVARSREMVWRAFRNEVWGILVCLLVGFVTGFVRAPSLAAAQSVAPHGRDVPVCVRR